METSVNLPTATKKRITQLLQILKSWEGKKITSVDISNLTGWKTSLIRHDFWYLRNFQNQNATSDYLKDSDNFFGVSNGYNVEKLKELIFEILGGSPFSLHNNLENKNCCVVGISNFGEAFLHSTTVQDSAFLIKAGFDTNLNLVEVSSSPFPLFHTNDMAFVIKKEKIEYAILTVKDKDAVLMTQRLINCGIKGIVNMTNVVLAVPKNIKVINLSVVNSLMELSVGTQPVK
jgi:redox-sensing transcriptional repressor